MSICRFDDFQPSDGQEGWVLITGPNTGNKTYERVFVISEDDERLKYTGSDAAIIKRMWAEVIKNYQQIHEKDLQERREKKQHPADYLGETPGQTGWSRHIWDNSYSELHPGTLCYVRRKGKSILGIYPVCISRDLFPTSPLSLLPEELRPATSFQQLSPADRVFGWVNQQGHGAYRGHVRIGPVICATDHAIESFGHPGLPLAILGQPKPQQARFYVAKDQFGNAQYDGLDIEQAGYSAGKGLRGRKVYPHHHGLPSAYWANPMQDRTQKACNGHFQEYRRPTLNRAEQRDKQNRSVQGWIRRGTEFFFDIHVTNLSAVELGALLWLLSLPEGHFHRFGGGKPLGFGSVRLEIIPEETRLSDGNGWKKFYSSLEDVPPPTEVKLENLVQAFQKAVEQAYGNDRSFEEVSFITAFRRMATGHPDGLPTHYPRARQPGQNGPVPPHPEGKAYEWFVANDRGPKVSLPNLADDNGLPILDAPKKHS